MGSLASLKKPSGVLDHHLLDGLSRHPHLFQPRQNNPVYEQVGVGIIHQTLLPPGRGHVIIQHHGPVVGEHYTVGVPRVDELLYDGRPLLPHRRALVPASRVAVQAKPYASLKQSQEIVHVAGVVAMAHVDPV